MPLGSGGPYRKLYSFLSCVILPIKHTKIIESCESQYAWIGQGSQNDTSKSFILFFEHDFSIDFN